MFVKLFILYSNNKNNKKIKKKKKNNNSNSNSNNNNNNNNTCLQGHLLAETDFEYSLLQYLALLPILEEMRMGCCVFPAVVRFTCC